MTPPRRVALAALAFFLVFGWKIGFYLDLILAGSVVAIVWAHLAGVDRHPRPILDVLFLLVLVATYTIAVTLASGGEDPFYLLRSIRVAVNFLGAVALAQLYRDEYGEGWTTTVLLHVFVAITAHAALVCVMFLTPPLREAIYAMADTRAFVNDTMPFRAGLRVPGLTYGLAMTSVIHMMALVLFPWVFPRLRSAVGRSLALVALPVLVVSILLTGRTGLALGLVAVPASMVLASRTGTAGTTFGPRTLIAAIVVAGALVFAAIEFGPDSLSDYNLATAEEVWMLFGDAGESVTVQSLRGMWFAPEGTAAIVFGTGNSGRGGAGVIHSDIGYVLGLHAVGIVGTILTLITPAIMLLHAWTRRHRAPALAYVLIILVVTALAVHAKEVALMTRNGWTIECLVFACLVLSTDRVPFNRAGRGSSTPSRAATGAAPS